MEHHFEVEDAQIYGVEKAVILYNLKYWIRHNMANGIHSYDDRTWTYNSAEAFTKLFPYYNAQKIARLLRQLEEAKVIMTGCYNTKGYDRTKWYAFVDEGGIFNNLKMHSSDLNNGTLKNEQPIPDINPDTKPDEGAETPEPTLNFEPEQEIGPGVFEHITTLWSRYNPAAKLDTQDKEILTEVIKLRGIDEIDCALSAIWEENAGKPPKWALKDFNWSLIKSETVREETHRKCPICERSTTLSGGVCYGCGLEVKDFDNEVVLAQIRKVKNGESADGCSLTAEFRQKTKAV
jgi:hypothetical protein